MIFVNRILKKTNVVFLVFFPLLLSGIPYYYIPKSANSSLFYIRILQLSLYVVNY